MRVLDQLHLLARYNEWINARLYQSAAKLSDAELALDRQAFFGSIIGTRRPYFSRNRTPR